MNVGGDTILEAHHGGAPAVGRSGEGHSHTPDVGSRWTGPPGEDMAAPRVLVERSLPFRTPPALLRKHVSLREEPVVGFLVESTQPFLDYSNNSKIKATERENEAAFKNELPRGCTTWHSGQQCGSSSKSRTTLRPSNGTTRHLCNGYRNAGSKGHTHPNVFSSAIDNSPGMERAQMSIG